MKHAFLILALVMMTIYTLLETFCFIYRSVPNNTILLARHVSTSFSRERIPSVSFGSPKMKRTERDLHILFLSISRSSPTCPVAPLRVTRVLCTKFQDKTTLWSLLTNTHEFSLKDHALEHASMSGLRSPRSSCTKIFRKSGD